jgi:hypothetical protein
MPNELRETAERPGDLPRRFCLQDLLEQMEGIKSAVFICFGLLELSRFGA